MIPPITIPDRLADLLNAASPTITGIDFIYVHPHTQLHLDIHFLLAPNLLTPALNTTLTTPANVLIYCPAEGGAVIPVTDLKWLAPDNNVMRLTVASPGDFALYKLKITNAQIDPYYNDVEFSFKAGCPSRLDCQPQPADCPPDLGVDFPIDYLARDFHSLKRALLEFASLRYPAWLDRLEADAGIMLTELMAAAGDEMAYHQDRIAREGYLETATQRRSLRRLARLVDYEMHDGLGSSAPMSIHVKSGLSGSITAGLDVWAAGNGGQRTDFEIGKGLADSIAATTYPVDSAGNSLAPHIWDKGAVCLPTGATQLYLEGNQTALFTPFGNDTGKWAAIQTYPGNPAQQQRTQLIYVTQTSMVHDPVLGVDTTLVVWQQAQALPFEFDLTVLRLHANILPATAGETQTAYFITGGDFTALPLTQQQALITFANLSQTAILDRTIERQGRDGTIAYRYTLPGADAQNLVWLPVAGTGESNASGGSGGSGGPASGDLGAPVEEDISSGLPNGSAAAPEVVLRALVYDPGTSTWSIDAKNSWTWRRALIGDDYASEPGSRDYTFDDGNWTRVVGYIDDTANFVMRDYAAGTGLSLLFGDGEFGLVPAVNTIFRVDYRLGGGNVSNVPAKAIINFVQTPTPALIESVINPLAAINGLDPQTADEVRQLAPQAYQNVFYRAVQPGDYALAAEQLNWVQHAGCDFRWTGSWISAFVTADPEGQIGLTADQVEDLDYQEERYRQAGREVIITQPVYANIDMAIEICAELNAYAGEVQQRVMTALFGSNGYPPVVGYFSPDRFTFGTLLERSTLEAAIQEVPGVLAVEWIRFRRRGWFDWQFLKAYSYDPGKNSIICLANDPLHPEEGILTLNIHGGL